MTVAKLEVNAGIGVLTMDRPDALNAFNNQMMDDLCEAFIQARDMDAIKVIVLTGAGRAFSAGADLKLMGTKQDPAKHGLEGLLDAIIDFPKPVIVAVNGVGAGIGCTICGLADMTFMAASARLRCPFSALGLTAEAASTYTFSRLMGHQQAAWLLLSSEWVSAQQCVDSGLALASFSDDKFMDEVMERAATLAALPLASLISTKNLMMNSHRAAMKAALRAENKELARLAGGSANREALTAFAEKRTPDFKGL